LVVNREKKNDGSKKLSRFNSMAKINVFGIVMLNNFEDK